jgi:hypothetical protein
MPGQSQPSRALRRRILGYPARAILGTLMSLAVLVAERRIRRALRSTAGPGDPVAAAADPAGSGPDDQPTALAN